MNLKVENLTKKIDDLMIFNGLNFYVEKGQLALLKGPSGCGKTTLLRIIAGLDTADSGNVFMDDVLVSGPKVLVPANKRKINMLFQDLALWPFMTGKQQIKFFWETNKQGLFSEELDKMCDYVGLDKKLLDRYPSFLSRGQQQRLALIRTFITKPKLLLLDEPLSFLDQDLRVKFADFIDKLHRSKSTTIIIVTHDLLVSKVKPDHEFVYQNYNFYLSD